MTPGPLAGRRILVTRRPEQAGSLRERLVEQGAEVVEVATIEIAPPDDPGPLDAALRALYRYHWLLFTSGNAVRFVADRFAALGLDAARAIQGVRVGSVGPATTAALRERLPGVQVALEPAAEFRAEGLVAALGDVAGQAILFPCSDKAREELPVMLEARGARVDVVTAYRTRVPSELGPRLSACLEQGVDLVTFASPSAVDGLVQSLGGRSEGLACAVIGPVTEGAARNAGLEVRATASPSTAEGLVAAIVALYVPHNP